MWFLSVWICCAIHDWMYRDKSAKTKADKDIADSVLLDNLTRWICARSLPGVRQLRMYRAITYFNAVQSGGDKAFFEGKES